MMLLLGVCGVAMIRVSVTDRVDIDGRYERCRQRKRCVIFGGADVYLEVYATHNTISFVDVRFAQFRAKRRSRYVYA